MSARLERLEFAPPPTPGLLRSVALAFLAHGLLVGVLTAGVAWKRTPTVATVSAELWSAVPQQAAAPAPEEVPEAPKPPVPEPPAPPEPVKPPPEPVKPPPDTSKADADIALAKKKAQKEKEEALRLEKLAEEKKAKLAKEKLEKEKLEKEKLAKEKADKDKLAQEKLAKEKAAKAKEAKEAKEAQALEEQRQANLKRIAGLAGGGSGGSGSANSTGSAMQDSGPSAGYAGRIVARIKPNIVFTESINGNPRVEVEIRTASTGAIISAKVTQSSGVKSWDEAVLRAIEKTEILPKDLDGRVPTSMQIGFRPKD